MSVNDAQLLAETLFSRTFQHPVLGPFIEWVPTAWLLGLANPTPSATTDLGNWGADEHVDWDQLFDNILRTGMRDPFLVGVGRVSRTVRLEAGNQRVRCMQQRQVLWVPAVAYVGDSAISHLGNGAHEGRVLPLKLPVQEDIMGPYPVKTYCKLSDVLVRMPE